MVSADQVASVLIARRGSWMDAWTLQKLLYYVQAWHAAITDEPLFPDTIKAYRDGPVVPEVRHSRKDRNSRRPSNQVVDGIEIDDTAAAVIDLVLAKYGTMSGGELVELTHTEQPWKDVRGDLPADAHSSIPMPVEAMARYFRSHGNLGGRTAADLAAGGVFVKPSASVERIDIDALLASLGSVGADEEKDPWGGANLVPATGHDAL